MKRQINDLRREMVAWQRDANSLQRDADAMLERAQKARIEVAQYQRAIALLEAAAVNSPEPQS